MDNDIHKEILALVKHYRETTLHMIRARNMRTQHLIRTSRMNLKMSQKMSFEFLQQMLSSVPLLAIMNVTPRIRTIGSKTRSSEWWDHDVLQTYNNSQWIENFRMNRQSFFKLVDFVRNELAVNENSFTESLTVEKKVGIAVYTLASCTEYRAIGERFGVSKSTVCVYLHAFCRALIATQMQPFLSWPDPKECSSIAWDIEKKYQLPNVIGVLGATHIPITPPDEAPADFLNSKGYTSIVLQAVVDDRLLFRNVSTEHSGCSDNVTILRKSYLYEHHQSMFPNGINKNVPFKLPYYIIGNPSYPLCDWIMKHYADEHTEEETSFNLHLNKVGVLVERAFARLKGRWRVLCKKTELNVYNMPHVIIACCILHNFVEVFEQQYMQRWDEEILEDKRRFSQPNLENNEDVDGTLMRDNLCAYMARHYPLMH